MQDPYFGHRDLETGKPLRDKSEKNDWDYALITALQIIEDNTDRHGLLSWEVNNDRMDVIAVKETDKFQAAVDRKTQGSNKKAYKPEPGEYFVPKLDLRGGEWPSYRKYLEKMIKENQDPDGTIE